MEQTLLDIAPLMIAATSIAIFWLIDLHRRRSYKRSETYEHDGSVGTQR